MTWITRAWSQSDSIVSTDCSFSSTFTRVFAITFKLQDLKAENCGDVDEDDILPGANKVLSSCLGVGYTNMKKRTNRK